MRNYLLTIATIIWTMILITEITANDSKYYFFETERLSGNWGGFRTDMEEAGVSFQAVYKGEYWGAMAGDVPHKTAYVDNIDLILDLDLEEIIGIRDFRFTAYFLGNNGDDPNDFVGSYQGVSNIAAYKTWKVYELSLYSGFFDDLICLKFGLLDLNADFDVKNTASVFLNPSHGIGPDFSQSGVNGPSVFPTTSLALIIRAELSDNIFWQAGIFDGVAGHPTNHNGTHIILDNDDGLLVSNSLYYSNRETISQLLGDNPIKETLNNDKYIKMGFSYWYYTDKYEYIFSHLTNWGFYGMFEMDLLKEETDPLQGLSVHGRIGVANDIVNQFDYYIGGGLTYTGPISGRGKDIIAFGVATGHNGYPWRLANRNVNYHPQSFEVNIEITYSMHLTPAITLQPDFQYYINPADLGYITDVFVIGSRLILNL